MWKVIPGTNKIYKDCVSLKDVTCSKHIVKNNEVYSIPLPTDTIKHNSNNSVIES